MKWEAHQTAWLARPHYKGRITGDSILGREEERRILIPGQMDQDEKAEVAKKLEQFRSRHQRGR